jgi:DNA-binding response OmpR family regulator
LAAGAVDYLTKPVSLKQLVNIIEQHLKPNWAAYLLKPQFL